MSVFPSTHAAHFLVKVTPKQVPSKSCCNNQKSSTFLCQIIFNSQWNHLLWKNYSNDSRWSSDQTNHSGPKEPFGSRPSSDTRLTWSYWVLSVLIGPFCWSCDCSCDLMSYLLSVISAGQCRAHDWGEASAGYAGDQGHGLERTGNPGSGPAQCPALGLRHGTLRQQTQGDFETILGIQTFFKHAFVNFFSNLNNKATIWLYWVCVGCSKSVRVTWHQAQAVAGPGAVTRRVSVGWGDTPGALIWSDILIWTWADTIFTLATTGGYSLDRKCLLRNMLCLYA